MNVIECYALLNKKVRGILSSVDHVEVDGTTLIFYFVDGSSARVPFPDPVGIDNVEIRQIDKEPHLICIMTDGSEIDAGVFPRGGGNCVYVGTQEPVDPMVQVWINPAEQGGGIGGGGTFTGIAGVSVGGIKEGDEFVNEPIADVIAKLLAPPYTKPKITIGINPTTILYDVEEDTLDKLTISANVTKNTEDIKYVKFYVDTTPVETLTEGVKDGGVFKSAQVFDPVKKETFSVKVETCDVDTQSVVSATTKIKFIGKTYYGYLPEAVTAPTEANIRGLQSTTLKDVKAWTYSDIPIPQDGELYKITYAYPQSFGALTKIEDSNGFSYFDDYVESEVKIGDIDYYCYMMRDGSGSAGATHIYG